MGTLESIMTNVAVYRGDELLGYVARTFGSGTRVICQIGDYRYHFSQRKAMSVKGAASKASVVEHKDGRKFYPRGADKLTFKLIDQYHR